jgi:hypothetical protein
MLEYLHGLLQPWRRVNRAEFIGALTVLSLPGLLLFLNGMVTGGAGILGPVLDLSNTLTMGQPGPVGALNTLQQLSGAGPAGTQATAVGVPFDFASLLNGLCLLLLTPYLRGRLLDMGYSARASMGGGWAIQLSVLNTTLQALTEQNLLPWAWFFGLFTALAYLWLSLRGSQARTRPIKAVHGPASRAKLTPDDDYPRL